jgi:rhodanese-related sulfurtransferase
MSTEISAESLYAQLGLPAAPVVIDVRRDGDAAVTPRLIPGALKRDLASLDSWVGALPPERPLVTCCDRGGEPSRMAADGLRELGYAAGFLGGGIEGWIAAEFPTVRLRADLKVPSGSRWITRERPKIDRLACPWLIRRFIDPEAQFFYTVPNRVRTDATALDAEPYDIVDVTFSHRGPRCSFDAFLEEFELKDRVLDEVADIVRAADTAQLEQSREAPGLLAISLGMSVNVTDDILLLEQAMPLYDALYAWRKRASHETHGWPQAPAPS